MRRGNEVYSKTHPNLQILEASKDNRAGTQKHPPTAEWRKAKTILVRRRSRRKQYHRNGLLGLGATQKGNKGEKKNRHRVLHSTVEDPPQVTEQDRRGQHSPLALAGGEAALSERTPPPTPHVSPTGSPATMAAAAGLSATRQGGRKALKHVC